MWQAIAKHFLLRRRVANDEKRGHAAPASESRHRASGGGTTRGHHDGTMPFRRSLLQKGVGGDDVDERSAVVLRINMVRER
jgi:hypothetical protein